MKILFTLILSSTLAACGSSGSEKDPTYKMHRKMNQLGMGRYGAMLLPKKSDGRLLPYLRKYEAEMGVHVNYPVVFGETSGNVIASCGFNMDGSKVVIVDRASWEDPPNFNPAYIEVFREITIYHELTHCSKNFVRHINNMKVFDTPNGNIEAPSSIMNEFLIHDPEVYLENRDYYIQELKSK
jgi:hypothetical protein